MCLKLGHAKFQPSVLKALMVSRVTCALLRLSLFRP